jgi:DMSO reductase anchor subunit
VVSAESWQSTSPRGPLWGSSLQPLPQAAFFLLLEAAVGGTIALFWVHLRGEVNRGFTLFTGACLLVFAILAVWLRSAFPPLVSPDIDPTAALWFAAERTLSLAFAAAMAGYLLGLRLGRWTSVTRLIGPLVPLLGMASLWAAALVAPSPQLLGLGTPLAVLAGALALGSALTGLSLGHWYLVSPTLSVKPLIQVTFLCLGALVTQGALLPLLLFAPGPSPQQVERLFNEYLVFFGVRIVFGLLVPLIATIMTWRTARIRSLDSATGLLYIVAALILAGEIAARTLFFLTGIAT